MLRKIVWIVEIKIKNSYVYVLKNVPRTSMVKQIVGKSNNAIKWEKTVEDWEDIFQIDILIKIIMSIALNIICLFVQLIKYYDHCNTKQFELE